MKKKERNMNLDLLRIIAMIFIIGHHLVINAFNLRINLVEYFPIDNNHLQFVLIVLNSIFVVGVNLFFLLSGYFRINFKWKKFVSIVFQTYFFYTIVTTIGIVTNNVAYSKDVFLSILNPFKEYWYITTYLLLMLFSPYLNTIIEKMNLKEFKKIFIGVVLLFCIFAFISDIGFSLNSGYCLLWAIMLYLIGGGISKNNIKFKKGIIGYLICVVLNSLVIYFSYRTSYSYISWKMYSYNSIFVFTESIFLILFFNSITIRKESKIIKMYAASTLTTYLLHSTCWLTIPRNFVITYLTSRIGKMIPLLLLPIYILLIYTSCMLIDLIYKSLVYNNIDKFVFRNMKKNV